MDGLQLIEPRVSMLCVKSRVREPIRAEAKAASEPACPPPITITSKFIENSINHLARAAMISPEAKGLKSPTRSLVSRETIVSVKHIR